MHKFKKSLEEIGSMLIEKNIAYGNSAAETEKFMKLLYPNGIKPEQYRDFLCITRIFDKLKKIATSNDSFNERPYKDIAGYSILLDLKRDKK